MMHIFILRFFAFTLFVFASVLSAFAENQVVIPKEVFIGDVVSLYYSFYTERIMPIKDGEHLMAKRDSFDISDSGEYTVISSELSRSGNNYTLSISLVPWKTGNVSLRPFDLLELIGNENSGENKKTGSFVIETKPFFVSPLAAKGTEELHPVAPPVLVPGTIYAVYAIIFLFVALFALSIWLICNFNRISAFSHRRAYHRALKELRRLAKTLPSLCDSELCYKIQSILRIYLSARFGYQFCTATSDKLESTFYKIIGDGMLPAHKEKTRELESLFHRLDVIRFSHAPVTRLGLEAKTKLINAASSFIRFFKEVKK